MSYFKVNSCAVFSDFIHNFYRGQNYDLRPVSGELIKSNDDDFVHCYDMPTEDLYQIALLIDQLRHEDLLLRVAASRSLSRIAQCLGPERTRDELVLSTILHQLKCRINTLIINNRFLFCVSQLMTRTRYFWYSVRSSVH